MDELCDSIQNVCMVSKTCIICKKVSNNGDMCLECYKNYVNFMDKCITCGGFVRSSGENTECNKCLRMYC